jgi:pimeloyl-ACP methyl ester carboxylesterase
MPHEETANGLRETRQRLEQVVDRFLTPRPVPFTPRDQDLIARGVEVRLECGLAATAWGDSGPTILLAHGWESRRTHWGAFIAGLTAAGFRVVAVDAPAHGDSPGAQANVLEYGLALVGVGRDLGSLFGVIGHSFGAGAVAVAVHRGLGCERVVLISGPRSLVSVTERWARQHGIDELELAQFVELVDERVGEPIENLELSRLATELRHPVLVVHDRGDEDIPVEDGLAVAAAWPGARTLITERYGHRRILIAKEVVREVVGFLRG